MLRELEHPLIHHWLAQLRDVETGNADFRRLVRSLTWALFLEASRGLPVLPRRVRTPLTEMEGLRLGRAPLLVPILRAGLGMADAVLEWVPEAATCHLGIYRDHDTLQPNTYYAAKGPDGAGRDAFILDPMLATGGSAVTAIGLVKQWDVATVRLLSLIGAPEGVQRVRAAHPDVEIYLCALDERLNEVGYIVPGLGDAGDRQFG